MEFNETTFTLSFALPSDYYPEWILPWTEWFLPNKASDGSNNFLMAAINYLTHQIHSKYIHW